MISGGYFPAKLPEAAAKKVLKINTKGAEEQSAPASPRVCSVEADAPDKFCSGKIARECQAPAKPQVLAVEADVLAAALHQASRRNLLLLVPMHEQTS